MPDLSGISQEQYLQSPLQLEHAFEMLLDSELFIFHSERMCEILTDEATSVRLSCPSVLQRTYS